MAGAALVHPPHWKSRSRHECNLCPSNAADEFRARRLNQLGAARVRMPGVRCCSMKEEEPLALRAAVSAVTELLRVFNRERYISIVLQPFPEAEDVVALYVSTRNAGDFNDALYAENCFFADPTVQFSGRDLYKRNLKLLVPFYEDPSLVLDDIQEVGDGESKFIQAFWKLRVYLKLPWRPFIAVDGSTKYELDASGTIAKHVESWNISGLQAIGQLFKPSERAFWKGPRSF